MKPRSGDRRVTFSYELRGGSDEMMMVKRLEVEGQEMKPGQARRE